MNSFACDKSLDAYKQYNKNIGVVENNFNRKYINPLPDDVKYFGSAAITLYKKELQFPLYRHVSLDVNSVGREMLSYRIEFP